MTGWTAVTGKAISVQRRSFASRRPDADRISPCRSASCIPIPQGSGIGSSTVTQSATDIGAHGARLTIDLGAIAANWRTLAARGGGVACAAVVKADAYGCG